MEFQSMIRRSTLTPVCFVYCSERACQNGFVWSLLYSAMTTVMDLAPADPRSQPAATVSMTATAAYRPTSPLVTLPSPFRGATFGLPHLSPADGRWPRFAFTASLAVPLDAFASASTACSPAGGFILGEAPCGGTSAAATSGRAASRASPPAGRFGGPM